MSCYRPKKGFFVGLTEKGRPKYKIMPFETDHMIQTIDGKWIPRTEAQRFEDALISGPLYGTDQWIQIPCGKCVGCKLDYARNWTARLMCEKTLWDDDECWFLTCTYDDEHLPDPVYGPDKYGCLDDDGNPFPYMTLDPRDHTLFMKRLRKAIAPQQCRFYGVGEYGSKSSRPHLHYIVFGLPLDEDDPSQLEFYKFNEFGEKLYKSRFLDSIWKKGYVTVGKVSARSCGYVARYCLKKIYSDGYDFTNRVPEFTRMSRSEGIGAGFVKAHPEIWDQADFCLPGSNGQKFQAPRFFTEKLRQSDAAKWQQVHDKRYAHAMANYHNMITTDSRPYLDQLRAKEIEKKQKISSLLRKL